MRQLLYLAVIIGVFTLGDAFSKYGRTCKDIGCMKNEICVMQEDPCTIRSKRNECGKYPTCKKVSNAAATCATYACPPTMRCRMDQGVPKCFASSGKSNKQGHPANLLNHPQRAIQYPAYYHHTNYPNTRGYPTYPSTGQQHGTGYPTPTPPQPYQYGRYQTYWNNGHSGQTYPRQNGYISAGQGGQPSLYKNHQRSGHVHNFP